MNRIFIFLLLSFILIGFFAKESVQQGKTCKQLMSEMTKRQLQGIAKCTKSMKFKNGKDKAKKMNCILKCVMTNEGILNDEGYFLLSKLNDLLEKEGVIPAIRESMVASMSDCETKYNEILDPKEEFCTTYDPLIKCLMVGFTKACA